jgi:FtsH-binding integral membrane protein
MRPNTVFLAGGVLALVFGLSFLLVPAMVLPVYGAPTDAATVLMSRFFGVALLHVGLLLYFLKDVRDPGSVRAIALAGVVGSIAGAVVALIGLMAGIVNAMGWSTVAIYGLLLLGYASCLRARTSPA